MEIPRFHSMQCIFLELKVQSLARLALVLERNGQAGTGPDSQQEIRDMSFNGRLGVQNHCEAT